LLGAGCQVRRGAYHGFVAEATPPRLANAPRQPLTIGPEGFKRVARFAVWALALTIVSGAAVRLSGSGLGCPDWPNCTRTDVVAPAHFHAWVEFANRLINGAVTLASLGALVAALRRRPRRRDLTWLSGGLAAGLLLEVAMGALVVYYKLAPALVMTHFLLGLAFLAVAVVLDHRAGLTDSPEGRGRHPLVGRTTIWLSRAMCAELVLVVTLGSVVTSTGPHGGSPGTPRFHFSLHSVAQLHGSSAELFLLTALALMWDLNRQGAPKPVIRRAQWLFGAMVAQAAVGYTQYFSGDPVGLVEVHVAGASLLVIALLGFHFGLWAYSPSSQPVPGRDDECAKLALVEAETTST
jgi:cytochrome c oxidase assembly protein subunit 15